MLDISEAISPVQRAEAAAAEAKRLSGMVVCEGRLQAALTDHTFEVDNPATGRIIGHAPRCGSADVDRAVASAQSAFAGWRHLTARDRAAFLVKAAARLESEAEAIAQLSAFETGNALATQTRGEAATMVDILRFFAGLAGEVKGQTIPYLDGRLLFTKREPLGVVAAIIPWNAPLMQLASKIGPALAAGNTVVLKTAEQAPLAVLRCFELMQEVLPPGVTNCISGLGEEAGRLLCEHPRVRKVTFTGSSAVGVKILHYAADKIAPVTAELGGKNPSVFLPDMDPAAAADGVVRGLRLQRQGQSCTAGTRVYIHDSIYDEVVERVLAIIPTFRVGDPLDERTQVGSIISKSQFDRVERYVQMARQTEGARILTGGARPQDPALKDGYFYQTTLIEGIPHSSEVCQDEIFGPVATLARWTDFAAVIQEANDVKFGLAATVWTNDLSKAFQFIEQVDAGFVQVNQYAVAEANIEYGGTKMSGMGKELSLESMLHHFTWSKTAIINPNISA
ncbi:aldehyde dehydrogenase family protein [Xanthobacter sp. VNH20]|uniref:aldehyde dehydrogenase family protein n=1 Tax=Xanthobacter sp. VNH20 TaxID=3156616 RepID=UPI0032B4FCAA